MPKLDRTQYRLQSSAARRATRHDATSKAINRHWRKVARVEVIPALAALAATVRAEIEPVIELNREASRMIASGLTRLPSYARQYHVMPFGSDKSMKPPLPYIGKLPPNR
jgi:hypothetical protein